MTKNTLLLGASTNQERYSYRATQMLMSHGFEVCLISKKKGSINGIEFLSQIPKLSFHTVTLYISKLFQQEYYQSIIELKPQRVIFNPGTENNEFQELLTENNISFMEACTLVLLSTHQY